MTFKMEFAMTRVHWFGRDWGSAICDPQVHDCTPVGKPCLHCDEPIAADDSGVIISCMVPGKNPREPVHHECFFRMTQGGVAHVEERCSCYVKEGGVKDIDPEGMTVRQAAKAAYMAQLMKEAKKQTIH